MKTLILNGSPRPSGDTAALLDILEQSITGDVKIIHIFYSNIAPCKDCRQCWTSRGCSYSRKRGLIDPMDIIESDFFDNIVIASPVHDESLPAPMMALLSRFQYRYANKKFAGLPHASLKNKRGAVILVGGGDGKHDFALKSAKRILSNLNAKPVDQNIIVYMNTDKVAAIEHGDTVSSIKELARTLSLKTKKRCESPKPSDDRQRSLFDFLPSNGEKDTNKGT